MSGHMAWHGFMFAGHPFYENIWNVINRWWHFCSPLLMYVIILQMSFMLSLQFTIFDSIFFFLQLQKTRSVAQNGCDDDRNYWLNVIALPLFSNGYNDCVEIISIWCSLQRDWFISICLWWSLFLAISIYVASKLVARVEWFLRLLQALWSMTSKISFSKIVAIECSTYDEP